MSELPGHLQALTTAEKCDLLDALWQDLEASSRLLTPEQISELDRRLAAHREDPGAAIPWEEIRAGLRTH